MSFDKFTTRNLREKRLLGRMGGMNVEAGALGPVDSVFKKVALLAKVAVNIFLRTYPYHGVVKSMFGVRMKWWGAKPPNFC